MNIKNILVISEHSPTDPPLALQKALTLFSGQKINLYVLCTVFCEIDEHHTQLDDDARTTLKETLLERAEAANREVIDNTNTGDREIELEVTWNKSVYEAVCQFCDATAVDLIIKTGLRTESLLHTPSDFHLARIKHIPTMFLRSDGWTPKPIVLATVEYNPNNARQSALNNKVVESARHIAELSGAELHCCYIVSSSAILLDMDLIEEGFLLKQFHKKHYQDFLAYVAGFGIHREQLHIKAGPPEKQIASIANDIRADLVVLGTHHREGVAGFFIGNTCEKVLSILRTDLLTIKPEQSRA